MKIAKAASSVVPTTPSYLHITKMAHRSTNTYARVKFVAFGLGESLTSQQQGETAGIGGHNEAL
jgi:hypothetical protein